MLLEAVKSKIRVLAESVPGENQTPGSERVFLTVSSLGGRSEGTLWGGGRSLIRAPVSPPKTPPPGTITLGVWVQYMNLGRTETYSL